MKCPSCGDTGLLPNHNFCPKCGFRLAHDQNIPSVEPKNALAVCSEKPKGESLQQNGTAAKKDQNKLPFDQQLGPMQAPDDDLSASPVQQEEAVAEERSRPSSESAPCSDGTPATTDPDNKDFGKAEEIVTSFVEGASAADTNTPDRAETGERQGEDIAWEQKVENKGEGQEDEGSTSQHQSPILAAEAVESLNDTCTSRKSTTIKIFLSRRVAVPMSTPGQQSNTFTRNEVLSSSNREIQGENQLQKVNSMVQFKSSSIQPTDSIQSPDKDLDADPNLQVESLSEGEIGSFENNQVPECETIAPDQGQEHTSGSIDTLSEQNSAGAVRSPVVHVESGHAPLNFSGDRVEIEMKNGVGLSTVHDMEIGTKPEESERNVRINLAEGGNGYQETENQQLESKGKLYKEEHRNTDESESESTMAQRSLIQERSLTLKQVAPEAGVTVVFHVLLASNFKMTDERLFIRAAGNDLGDFRENCVDMFLVETVGSKDKERLMLFRGEFTLSLDRTLTGVFYKYVVVKKGNLHWEQLPEFSSSHCDGSIVNRALKIPENCIEPGVTWNQVDGVAYVYGDKGMFSKVVDYLSGKDNTAEYRAKALLCFRPKWKGFLVEETPVRMDATDAVKSLIHVVDCLSYVWIEEAGYFPQKMPTNFNVQKVLWDLLKTKMEDNVSTLEKFQDGSSNNVSAVVSSLAILLMVDKYAIKLKREEVNTILRCLALEADAAEQKCSAYEAVLTEFDAELRQYALHTIARFCNDSMKQAGTPNPEWLLAMPLLHFLRGDSKPFEEPEVGESPKTLDWWGAQGLAIKEFQRSEKQDYTDVWPRLVAAFQVDLLLKRTVLRALPLWALLDIIPDSMFDVSDVCVALVTSFPRGNLNNEKKIVIEKCILSLNNILEGASETISSNMKIMKFRVSASLELVNVCLDSLRYREGIKLICHAIKLLFTGMQQYQHAIEESQTKNIDKLQEIETLKKDHLDKLWVKLKSYLESKLAWKMPDNYQNEALPRELEVWSMLLRVTDGTQGFEGYRKYLTEHFMVRAKKVIVFNPLHAALFSCGYAKRMMVINRGQNMQICHPLRSKQIDMSTADQLILIVQNNTGTPLWTFRSNAVTLKYNATFHRGSSDEYSSQSVHLQPS